MKTPPFLLIGCPLLVLTGAVVYFATFRALHQTPFHAALIAAETPGPVLHTTRDKAEAAAPTPAP